MVRLLPLEGSNYLLGEDGEQPPGEIPLLSIR